MPKIKRCHAVASSTRKRCCNGAIEGVGYCRTHSSATSGDPAAAPCVCACCLDFVSASTAQRASPRCGHVLHLGCAKKWVHTGVTTCPTCRTDLDIEYLRIVDKAWRLRVLHAFLQDFRCLSVRFHIPDVTALTDVAAASRLLLSRPQALLAHPPDEEFTFLTANSVLWTLPMGVSPFFELYALSERAKVFEELYARVALGLLLNLPL